LHYNKNYHQEELEWNEKLAGATPLLLIHKKRTYRYCIMLCCNKPPSCHCQTKQIEEKEQRNDTHTSWKQAGCGKSLTLCYYKKTRKREKFTMWLLAWFISSRNKTCSSPTSCHHHHQHFHCSSVIMYWNDAARVFVLEYFTGLCLLEVPLSFEFCWVCYCVCGCPTYVQICWYLTWYELLF
jgi:hypothetical protein